MAGRRSGKGHSPMPPDSNKTEVKIEDNQRQSQLKLTSTSFNANSKPQIKSPRSRMNKLEATRCVGNAPSLPGAEEKTLSYRPHHSRKRSHSLPNETSNAANTEVTQHTRSEAISLLRARTLSRLSDCDPPLLDSVVAAPKTNPTPRAKVDDMARDQASIMDFVTTKKPRRKTKKKKTASREISTDENVSTEEWFAETTQTEHNTAAMLAHRTQDGTAVAEQSDFPFLGTAAQMAPRKETGKTNDNNKGKQHTTASGTASTTMESNPDVSQPTVEPSAAERRLSYARAVVEASKSLNAVITDPDTSTPSPAKSFSPRNTSAMEGTPPSTADSKSRQGSVSDSPALCASTPKSSTTVSTGYTWTTHPTTAASEDDLDDTSKSEDMTITQATVPQAKTPHSHPSPTKTPDIQHRRGQTITSQKPKGFFYQLDSHGFPCSLQNCEKRCNLWDGSSVICPKCGPYSSTQYCTRAHLLSDTTAHWLICGTNAFKHPCRKSSIPRSVRDESPPLIPCLHAYDTPERHRQAVYFNMNAAQGDYFIFSDWMDLAEAGFPEDYVKRGLRCRGRVIHAVKFEDGEERDRFRRVLAACLFVTIESPQLIDYLFRLLRDSLRATLTPTPTSMQPTTTTTTTTTPNTTPNLTTFLTTLLTTLEYQLFHEFATTIQPAITGDRHACPTDWTGINRRNCTDAVCRSENQRLLGSLGCYAGGFKTLVENLEGSYWVLRAARVTHPLVKSLEGRIRGEGFLGVAEEDMTRRVWRGVGWEGVGDDDNGEFEEREEMDIEGVNVW